MEDVSAWMMVLDKLIIPLLFLILTPVLTALMKRLLLLLQQKWGVEMTDKKMKQIDQLVRESIDFAEEQAHKLARSEKTDVEEALSGPEKMNIALDYMTRRATQLGLTEVLEDHADVLADRVESMLFGDRKSGKRPKAEPKLLMEDGE